MDFKQATLKKATVSTLPLWAEVERGSQQHQQQQSSSSRLEELPEEHDQIAVDLSPDHVSTPPLQPFSKASSSTSASSGEHSISSTQPLNNHKDGGNTTKTAHNGDRSVDTGSSSARVTKPTIPLYSTSSIRASQQQDWSVFATMSNVSTISSIPSKYKGTLSPNNTINSGAKDSKSTEPNSGSMPTLRSIPLKLDELFKFSKPAGRTSIDEDRNEDRICTCTCPEHGRTGNSDGMLSARTSKRRQKECRENMRGYPSGQCTSTTPPEHTSWDEKGAELPLTHELSTAAKNTAFNIEAMKAFLNSPLFSNILKSLTIIAAVSLFAIALDAIVILVKTPEQETHFSNDNTALIITVILSLMTIAYSCFTIFLESRRPPEGLDSSSSKPLFVIFSEIIASIIWAQILSITIYIYIWTYGCTAAGERQLQRLWKQDFADQHLSGMLCRRHGAMVGLELLLVLLLIFNFYTHLALNFKFIRAVSY
ncbi:hypothetical protein BX616_003534 [Lobosporangium transversale]|uniref:Uncharacterized protein n=1 Tax=Lobosporangium transversale TaxID=64571 RepID=A0A1Y2GXC5_9FUNG|nr:hypothetical protein BCR41DRAFT_383991 [Lobosporangium transversale]KAF9916526.1 hypothetical protein BX616_003534 [Lobosporangium transversale]ORZ26936.1 hypothetical protein BCR41DRAFT_383991 [Lobosporangium transversale]|eukprot:XP_021884683.1 hypothetical protein BCR41DRAFT_383991 [Lobosporangium transversale]